MSLLLDWRAWLAVAFAALAVGIAIQTSRLHTAEARLDAAQQKIAVLGADIARQNAAVDALKVESDRKVRNASEALAEAQEGTHAARTEAERLRVAAKAAAAQKPSSGPAPGCPPSGADRAVATIRGSLP